MKLQQVKFRDKIRIPGPQSAIMETGHFSRTSGFEIELDEKTGMVWITKSGETKGVHSSNIIECTLHSVPAQAQKAIPAKA